MSKKYTLGALNISDVRQMERDEIIIELIDRMQKYVVEAENMERNITLDVESRLLGVRYISGCFCGLANFLNVTLCIDARTPSGIPYTQELYSRIFYLKQKLEIELKRQGDKSAEFSTSHSHSETAEVTQ